MSIVDRNEAFPLTDGTNRSSVPVARHFHPRSSAGEALAAEWQAGAAELAKRTCDIVLSTILIVLLLPVMTLVAAAVAIDGGPVFYAHTRVGRHGKPFGCLKFRTMVLGASQCLEEYLSYHPAERAEWERHVKLTRDPRITPIGRLLRETSLDELPQLWNVLLGDMSLVGPRPVTEAELPLYGERAALLMSVRPGITGPWQIGGRNEVGYDERSALDAAYAVSRSFAGDMRILARTPAVVLSRRGAR